MAEQATPEPVHEHTPSAAPGYTHHLAWHVRGEGKPPWGVCAPTLDDAWIALEALIHEHASTGWEELCLYMHVRERLYAGTDIFLSQ